MERTLGDAVRARREELDLTQTELAARMGAKSHGWISQIENGEIKSPSAIRLAELASLLGLTVGDLLSEEHRSAIVLGSQIAEARRTAGTLLNMLAEIDPASQPEGIRVIAISSQALQEGFERRHFGPLDPLTAAELSLELIQAVRASGNAWVVGTLFAGPALGDGTAEAVAAMIEKGQV